MAFCDQEFNIETSYKSQQHDSASEDPVARGPKPRVPQGKTAPEYSHAQLLELTKWVLSDNVPRTDDELKEELMNELALTRRGLRINLYLNVAISNARREAAEG